MGAGVYLILRVVLEVEYVDLLDLIGVVFCSFFFC
jgi:hypothetical protein